MFEWVRSKEGLDVEKRVERMRPLFRQMIEEIAVSIHRTSCPFLCHEGLTDWLNGSDLG